MNIEELSAWIDHLKENALIECDTSGKSMNELILMKAALSALESKIKNLQYDIRNVICDEIEKVKEAGGDKIVLKTPYGSATLNIQVDKTPDEEAFRTMLVEKSIPIESGMDVVVSMYPSPSKIEMLVKTGKLIHKDVDALKDRKKVLTVKPIGDLKKILEGL